MKRMPKSRCAFLVLALLSIALRSAMADTYTVNTSSDAVVANACANHQANCSLRGAILAANAHSGDTIVINIFELCQMSGCAIGVLSALPDITAPMTISGPTAFAIQRGSSATGDFRIFNVTTTGTVNFTELTISGGQLPGGGNGGGIQNVNGGTVNVTNCILKNNVATAGGGISNAGGVLTVTGTSFTGNNSISSNGAAVSNGSGMTTLTNCTFTTNPALNGAGAVANVAGTLNIRNCTFSGNASFSAGAVVNAGAGTTDIVDSTLSGNSARSNGGGAALCLAGTLNFTNCTVTGNIMDNTPNGGAGGVLRTGGTVNVRNTIIALNTATGFNAVQDVSGAFVSGGFNIIGKKDGSTGFTSLGDQAGSNAVPLDPKLDSNGLQDNGGPTKTIALLTGSIAIDQGNGGNAATDQRGLLRPYDNPSIINATAGNGSDVGAFEVQATPTATPTATATATPKTVLANISTRLKVETGDDILIAGFIVTGTQDKKVIIRAIGSSLTLPGKLENPTLELRDSAGNLLKENDDWMNSTPADKQAIIDSTIPPSNDLESAIVATLPAHSSAYTALVRGVNNSTGIGVVEAYDLDQNVDSILANISTRGLVQTDPDVLIAGTIVLGPSSRNVIIRAIGPSLPIANKLLDPTLELRDSNGGLLQANDNWMDSPNKQAIIDSTVPPSDPMESAIVETLPGNGASYTAIVRGVNGTTGIAVVEVYALQ